MNSLFSMRLESSDDETISDNVETNGEDIGLMETATDELHSAETEGSAFDELQEGEEKVREIKDEVQLAAESFGLSDNALRYLRKSVSNIVGKSYTSKRMPSMESYSYAGKVEGTRIVLENIKQTLKELWAAIKAKLNGFWTKMKGWYVKTFDVANSIIKRAKSLEEKSNALTSSPTEKTFDMSGSSMLFVNYQIKEPNLSITGLSELNKILETVLTHITKQNQNDKSDAMIGRMDETVKTMKAAKLKDKEAKISNGISVAELLTDDMPKYESVVVEASPQDSEIVKKLGITADQQIYTISKPLPGNKSFFVITPKVLIETTDNLADDTFIDAIKGFRYTVSETNGKSRELEDSNTVKTLTASQISAIASTSLDIGETILKFKKQFESRDKFMNKIVKGFDTAIKDMEDMNMVQEAGDSDNNQTPVAPDTNDGGNGETKQNTEAYDKVITKFSNATLGLFRKNMKLSGLIINESVKAASAFLSWGEQSAKQYAG